MRIWSALDRRQFVIIGYGKELIGKKIAAVDSDPESESWSVHDRGRPFQCRAREPWHAGTIFNYCHGKMYAVAAAVYYWRSAFSMFQRTNKFLPIATGNARRPPGDGAIIMHGDIVGW